MQHHHSPNCQLFRNKKKQKIFSLWPSPASFIWNQIQPSWKLSNSLAHDPDDTKKNMKLIFTTNLVETRHSHYQFNKGFISELAAMVGVPIVLLCILFCILAHLLCVFFFFDGFLLLIRVLSNLHHSRSLFTTMTMYIVCVFFFQQNWHLSME